MINKYAEINDRILLYNACKGILRVKRAAIIDTSSDVKVDPDIKVISDKLHAKQRKQLDNAKNRYTAALASGDPKKKWKAVYGLGRAKVKDPRYTGMTEYGGMGGPTWWGNFDGWDDWAYYTPVGPVEDKTVGKMWDHAADLIGKW